MHARVATIQLKPGTADQVQQGVEQLGPQMQGVQGLRGAYVLLDRETNELMTLALFDTAEDSQAYAETTLRGQVMERLRQVAAGEPRIATYEVVFQV